MKTKIIIIILTVYCSMFAVHCFAQNWLWSKNIGGSSTDYFSRNCTDSNGNIYLAGDYSSNPCYFNSDTLSCNGVTDFFLTKYDASGNELWVKQFGGYNSAGESEGVGDIAYDSNNNFIYMTGNFSDLCNFGTTSLQSTDSADVFIAKFDLNGNCIWAKKAGGFGNGYSYCISIDNNGNAIIAGENNDSTTFDNIKIGKGTFIAKYDFSGNCIWAKQRFINSSNLNSTASIIALKIYNNDIFTVGISQSDTIIIDTITIINPNANFIARFDSIGNAKWLKTFSNSGINGSSPGLAMNSNGDCYVATQFHTTGIFGNDTLHSISSVDFALAKYSQNGFFVWAIQGNSSHIANTGIGQVAVSNDGNIYVFGTLIGSIIIGTSTISSTGLADIFLARYDNNGNGIGACHVPGANSYSISTDNLNQICISGSIFSSATFGSNPTLISHGYNDIFIAKSDAINGINEKQKPVNNQLIIYANPNEGKCNVIMPDEFVNENNLTLQIFDSNGKLIQQSPVEITNDKKLKINIQAEAKGIYTAILSNGKKSYTGKIVFE